jgi:hypothetical protein
MLTSCLFKQNTQALYASRRAMDAAWKIHADFLPAPINASPKGGDVNDCLSMCCEQWSTTKG